MGQIPHSPPLAEVLAQNLANLFLAETPPPDAVEVKSLIPVPKTKLKFNAVVAIKVHGFQDHQVSVQFGTDHKLQIDKQSLVFTT